MTKFFNFGWTVPLRIHHEGMRQLVLRWGSVTSLHSDKKHPQHSRSRKNSLKSASRFPWLCETLNRVQTGWTRVSLGWNRYRMCSVCFLGKGCQVSSNFSFSIPQSDGLILQISSTILVVYPQKKQNNHRSVRRHVILRSEFLVSPQKKNQLLR